MIKRLRMIMMMRKFERLQRRATKQFQNIDTLVMNNA